MQSILVTPETLERQAEKVNAKAAEYYNHYARLLSEVQNMTSTDFRGEDGDAFRTKVENFRTDFDKMRDLMEQYAMFLREAAQRYRDTQERVKGSISGLAK